MSDYLLSNLGFFFLFEALCILNSCTLKASVAGKI